MNLLLEASKHLKNGSGNQNGIEPKTGLEFKSNQNKTGTDHKHETKTASVHQVVPMTG